MSDNVATVSNELADALDFAVKKRLICSITRDKMEEPFIPFISDELKPLNNIDLPTFVGLLAYGYTREKE